MQRVQGSIVGDGYVVAEAFRIGVKPAVQNNGNLGIHFPDCSDDPSIEAVQIGRGSADAGQPLFKTWIAGILKPEFAVWVWLVERIVGNNCRVVHEPTRKVAPE